MHFTANKGNFKAIYIESRSLWGTTEEGLRFWEQNSCCIAHWTVFLVFTSIRLWIMNKLECPWMSYTIHLPQDFHCLHLIEDNNIIIMSILLNVSAMDSCWICGWNTNIIIAKLCPCNCHEVIFKVFLT